MHGDKLAGDGQMYIPICIPTARRIEAVYRYTKARKLKVVVAVFEDAIMVREVEQEGVNAGGKRLKVSRAYSNMTRSSEKQRVEVWRSE